MRVWFQFLGERFAFRGGQRLNIGCLLPLKISLMFLVIELPVVELVVQFTFLDQFRYILHYLISMHSEPLCNIIH